MDKNYLLIKTKKNEYMSKVTTLILILICFFTLGLQTTIAQNTYTIGNGTSTYETLGVSPFSTINRNSRSQYLYYGQELVDLDAISGNIISVSVNITQLALPLSLKPQNIKIKMGMTDQFVLPSTMVENLPIYYESTTENISQLGWYTFTLQTPFEWNGFSNIIVEICRSNEDFGTSFEVQCTEFNENDYRTTGLYTNEASQNGCGLTGSTEMGTVNRRRRPNMQFTMTQPCNGLPSAGVTVATAGPYCNGNQFTLSIQNGSIESGLFYQWQYSPNDNGPWTDIPGANSTTYTTSQSIATYYRRTTTCIETQLTINDQALLVGGEGCYCTALVVNENPIGITNVSLNEINNSSSSVDAYTSFTNFQTDLEREESYPLSVRVNTNGGTNYTKAWIDWNQNADFEASEEVDLGSVSGGIDTSSGLVATINVPVDAVLGSTIMRVRTSQSSENNYPTACGPIENGEAEDYTITIIENLSLDNFNPGQKGLIIATNQSGVHVKLIQDDHIKKIAIYDLSGRMVFVSEYQNSSQVSISNFKPSQQMWIVRVTTNAGKQVTKNIIY